MDKVLDPLNRTQKEAVLCTDGALLVLAGAGSGKTRVITHRFAYLLREKKLRMDNILAITFTNKAAGEMKERIQSITGHDVSSSWIRTFHSMGAMVLRKKSDVIDYPRDFVIYDDTDSRNIIKNIMSGMRINVEKHNPGQVSWKISNLKDNLVNPAIFAGRLESKFDEMTLEIYYEYEKALRKNRAVDFPDLIALPIRIFNSNQPVLKYYQDLWKYIMVDEFQDTNSAQYELVKIIADRDKNVCVVGDDDQSIYGWRGADIGNIYDFENHYGARLISLEQNYRSTDYILKAANSVVKKISGRKEKSLWTERKGGDRIRIVETAGDREEAGFIADEIDKLLKDLDYRDFAVFYRTNAQSRAFEEELVSRRIPYKIFGGQKFYERKEIKDILAYIRLIVNPYDRVSFERILNVPKRRIGESSLEKITLYALNLNATFIEALTKSDGCPGLSKQSSIAMAELGNIISELRSEMEKISPVNFIKILIDSISYREYIINFDQDGLDRWSNVEELTNSIRDFENANPDLHINDFLNEASLQTSFEETDSEGDKNNYVSLMTIHNAKGLEFPVVFICGVVEGLLPHANTTSTEELNEERRLFYVAITRAKNTLYITYPSSRMIYGDLIMCSPSPFLMDIPEELSDFIMPEQTVYGRYRKTRSNEKNIDFRSTAPVKGREVSGISEIKEGDILNHRNFGRGKVTFVSARIIKANFEKYGVQVLSGNFLSSISLEKS